MTQPTLLASILNTNSGAVLKAVQLLSVSFLVGLFPALEISTNTTEPGIMAEPPRDPSVPIYSQSGPFIPLSALDGDPRRR